MTTVAGIHQGADTHANRPAANTVTAGTLYSCSDHDLIYISDGSTWSTYATVGGGGASPLTTKGDVYVYGTADARLPLGTDGHVLTADSAQTLGVKWAAAAGGSSSYGAELVLSADDAPGSADAMDDEFDDSSIDGKWSQQSGGTSPTWTERGDGMLYLSAAAESGHNWKTITQTAPSAQDYTIEAMLGPFSSPSADHHKPAGLVLAEGTTAQKLCYFGWLQSASVDRGLVRTNLTNYTTFGSNGSTQRWEQRWPTYLRIQYVHSTTTFTFQFSGDGQVWFTYDSTASLGFTPTKVGLGGNVESSTTALGSTFGWFRRTV